jgi:hypothetical protein
VKAPKGLKVIKQPKAPAAPKAPPASMPAAPKAPKAPAAPKAAKPGRKQAGPGLGLADPESRARWEERRLLDEILGIDDEDYERFFGRGRDEYDPEPRVSLSRRLRAEELSDERSQVVPAQTTAQDWPGGQAMNTGYQPSSTSESAGAALPAEAGGSAVQSPQQSSQGPSGRQQDQMGVDGGPGQGGFGGSGMGMDDVMGIVSPLVNAGAGIASGVASGVGGAISGLGAPGLGGAISGLGGALSGAASGVMSGVSGLGGMFTGAAVEHYYRTGSWHGRTAGGSYDGSWPDDEPWGSLPGGQQVRGEAPKVKRKRKRPRVEWRDGEPYSQ